MDVVFLKSNELNWQQNYDRAKTVLGEVQLIDGSSATSIKNAYEIMLSEIDSEYFMMIEADNFVFDNCADYLSIEKPVKFWTTNKFGVQYEHGGVKIMHTDSCISQLKTNANIYKNFEISANLFLESIPTVVSSHNFDWSHKNEWVSIAKELIKLHFWGHKDYINLWIKSEVPCKIYQEVLALTEHVGFTELFETLLPSLGKIYDQTYP